MADHQGRNRPHRFRPRPEVIRNWDCHGLAVSPYPLAPRLRNFLPRKHQFLFIAYNLVVWPLKAARHAFYYHGVFGTRPGPRVMVSLWDSFVWLAFVGVVIWLACRNFPQVEEAVRNIPAVFHDAVDNVRNWWSHH